jgi:hypothetical protein
MIKKGASFKLIDIAHTRYTSMMNERRELVLESHHACAERMRHLGAIITRSLVAFNFNCVPGEPRERERQLRCEGSSLLMTHRRDTHTHECVNKLHVYSLIFSLRSEENIQ